MSFLELSADMTRGLKNQKIRNKTLGFYLVFRRLYFLKMKFVFQKITDILRRVEDPKCTGASMP